jgi:hypothetical protein
MSPPQDAEAPGTEPSIEAAPPDPPPAVTFEQCELSELVQKAAAEAAKRYPSVLVQVQVPPRLPAVGEPEALRGVVRILVENACADSEAGSDVTVKAQRTPVGISVLVMDRGTGGARDQMVALSMGEQSADESPPSGFNLARGLVAMHGGILWAEPLPAGGSRVSFTIPEEPPLLSGTEIEQAVRALQALELLDAAPEPEPEEEEPQPVDGELLEEVLDLDAAAEEAPEPLTLADVEQLDEPRHEEPPEQGPVQVPEPVSLPEPIPASAPEAETPQPVQVPEPVAAPTARAAERHPASVAQSEPAPAAASTKKDRPKRPKAEPPKKFHPDPLNPATALLRSLAEEYDQGLF